ncbi:methylmalonyl-CoA mutase [Streptomyces sp. SID5770]|uniref:cobalamin B12-binding domain-containing protein n=1 Tax=Streptomyces sp. SID5770 TaxID=2690308 RepID=UPI0013696AB3|nr:cobalamin-dependent protein [Streptomyces sp. SID5770]MZE54271.1 methylmalonyl-CoA mutase [Streptomyces sp. SID5770]
MLIDNQERVGNIPTTSAWDCKRKARKPRALIGTIASDSHTWNLIFIDLLLKELGFHTMNLGPCTPLSLFLSSFVNFKPDMIIVSSVNGHARSQAPEIAAKLKLIGATSRLVAGGKLSTGPEGNIEIRNELQLAGFHAVFFTDDSIGEFTKYAESIKSAIVS